MPGPKMPLRQAVKFLRVTEKAIFEVRQPRQPGLYCTVCKRLLAHPKGHYCQGAMKWVKHEDGDLEEVALA